MNITDKLTEKFRELGFAFSEAVPPAERIRRAREELMEAPHSNTMLPNGSAQMAAELADGAARAAMETLVDRVLAGSKVLDSPFPNSILLVACVMELNKFISELREGILEGLATDLALYEANHADKELTGNDALDFMGDCPCPSCDEIRAAILKGGTLLVKNGAYIGVRKPKETLQ
jgi:hypothetical protein